MHTKRYTRDVETLFIFSQQAETKAFKHDFSLEFSIYRTAHGVVKKVQDASGFHESDTKA